jgi:hypothetical protein
MLVRNAFLLYNYAQYTHIKLLNCSGKIILININFDKTQHNNSTVRYV